MTDTAALAGGALLAGAALAHALTARRQRAATGVWIGAGLAMAGVAAVLHGLTAPGDPANDLLLLRKTALVLTIGGIGALHRAATMLAHQRAVALLARALLVASVLASVALPSMWYHRPGAPAWWWGHVALVVTAVAVACFDAARTVWLRAEDRPSYVANRCRLLAAGIASFGVAHAFGLVGATSPTVAVDMVTGIVALAFLLPALVALVPPATVRALLRSTAAASLHDELDALAEDDPRANLSTVLPLVCDVLGANLAQVESDDGIVRHRHGSDPDAQAPERLERRLPLRAGGLRLHLDPHAPVLGRAERRLAGQLARDLDLAVVALDHKRALDSERAAHEELEAANRRLDVINEALSEFGSTVAHDLRTPLTVVRGTIETVLNLEDLSPLGTDLLRRALGHVDRANDLIAGQLDVAHDPDSVRTVSLEHVARWVARTVNDELIEHHAMLTWDEPLPHVHGSEPVLRRVLLNLVRNAIQHASDPPRRLMIAILPGEDRRSVLVLDNGRGISSEDWPRLFRQGERLEGASSGGHGLGLAGARKAMQRIGGDVELLDSHPGQGSTFLIRLPSASQWSVAPGRTRHDDEASPEADVAGRR